MTQTQFNSSQLPANIRVKSIGAGLGIPGGTALTAPTKPILVYVPYACTINSVTIVADVSGSLVLDIWVAAYPTIPTVTNTITASDKPTLSSAQVYKDTTLTGWTLAIAAGSIVAFSVTSVSTIGYFNVQLGVVIS